MDIHSFWERVNTFIKERKTTQRAISAQCGFTERRVETLVSTERPPDVLEAAKIAAALSTTVEYLVSGAEPDASRKYRDALEHIRDIAVKSL
jgi:transcriptional regulator with XRE-family HTH domain